MTSQTTLSTLEQSTSTRTFMNTEILSEIDVVIKRNEVCYINNFPLNMSLSKIKFKLVVTVVCLLPVDAFLEISTHF